MKRIWTIFAVVTLCLALGGIARADMVINGDFETGDFTGWTQSGDTAFTSVSPLSPHSGTYSGLFGPKTPGYISQTLATDAGEWYRLVFWLKNVGDIDNQFIAQWDGSTLISFSDIHHFSYTPFAFDVVATGPSTDLTFGFRYGPHFWFIDDISATLIDRPATVPLPGAVWLLGSGLMGLVGVRRFRK